MISICCMAHATGVGVVGRKNDRGNPQVCWSVYRKSDAVALASFLTRSPLRSRKRKDFQLWSLAVEHWAGNDDVRRSRLAALAREIRNVRRYLPLDDESTPATTQLCDFYEWLAGFVAGDGYLRVSNGATWLTVRLRADDASILAAIRATTGAGHVGGPYSMQAHTRSSHGT
jgi:hypothetical protein